MTNTQSTPAPGNLKQHRIALIDGDIIVYRASAYAHSHQEDVLDLQERIVADVDDWTRRAFCTEAIVCLSGPREDSFRRQVYPAYKLQRTDERPAMHGMGMEMMAEHFKVFQRRGLEADDGMGLLATLGTVINPVMVTIDKDLRTVPGWHFNPTKEDFPVLVSFDQAERAFLLQWLGGDSSDGYKGIPGIGEKKAEKILGNDISEGVTRALQAYQNADLSYEYALQMACCARILTSEWWDTETKSPILWTPGEGSIAGRGGLERYAEEAVSA